MILASRVQSQKKKNENKNKQTNKQKTPTLFRVSLVAYVYNTSI